MLNARRHYFGSIICVLIGLIFVGALMPDPLAEPAGTDPGVVPTRASLVKRLTATANAAKATFRERFGYSATLPFIRAWIDLQFSTSSTTNVFFGAKGQLFYNLEGATEQSAGRILRVGSVERFVDMADTINRLAIGMGAKFLVALPPNAQSVVLDVVPAWARANKATEYDLALALLRERNIQAVDLRDQLRGAGMTYRRTDTHWNQLGALLAFNATMSAAGHPEWAIDPATALGPVGPVPGGDLARMLALQHYLIDENYPLSLPDQHLDWRPRDLVRSAAFMNVFNSYVLERKLTGERVLLLGNSFTQHLWEPMMRNTGAARIGWMHHALCRFDWRDVENFEPTLLILAPVEREIPCPPDAWPIGLPRK